MAEPRAFTQAIAGWVYQQSDPDGSRVAGVRFESRHGDALPLWAVFERPGDGDVSGRLTGPEAGPIDVAHVDLVEAMCIHGLHWAK